MNKKEEKTFLDLRGTRSYFINKSKLLAAAEEFKLQSTFVPKNELCPIENALDTFITRDK